MTLHQATPLDQSLPNLLRLTHLGFLRQLERQLEPYQLPVDLWKFLRALWEQDGVGAETLSEKLQVSSHNVESAIAELEKRGLVTCRSSGSCGSKSEILLTDAAKKLQVTLGPVSALVLERGLRRLSEAERDQLVSLITTVLRSLQESA